MKITKTALSIISIAISSSAFAAPSPDGQPSYDIVANAAGQNIYEGARGESARQALRSVDEAFYAGIQKSINDYEASKVLANQLAITEPPANIIFGTKGDPVLISEVMNHLIERNNAESLKSSLVFALSEKAKQGFLGARSADLDISTYSNAKESTARALNGTLFFKDPKISFSEHLFGVDLSTANNEFSKLYNYAGSLQDREGSAAMVGNMYGKLVLGEISLSELHNVFSALSQKEAYDASVRKNIIARVSLSNKVKLEDNLNLGESTIGTSDFKTKENADAISEFNALQELALKQSDPQVKTLIKQAADLKMETYRVAAAKN
ncbi:hypothetical protein [Pseudomonas sp. ATCC PTA-122608]|uniref:hypothetical protein n=1 Tax=Pseudomonas sp. ATCC PTA-122608 TaxID=1771311 RepID=UPI00117995E5|nr:hypothetical protein [Pseudomonas sp. ATCC PTA-122608]